MKTSDPHVRGYCRAYWHDEGDASMQTMLFRDKIPLILERQSNIMSCSDYFFCGLAVGHCCVGLSGAVVLSGPIRLGHLLIGWRHGILIEQCQHCGGKLLITSFTGNIQRGTNWWHGLCLDCKEWSSSSSSKDIFRQRLEVAKRILKRLPDQLEKIEFYSGYEFDWGGDGLRFANKKRAVVQGLYDPAPFDVLVQELESGSIRKGRPPVVGLSQDDFKRKFSIR